HKEGADDGGEHADGGQDHGDSHAVEAEAGGDGQSAGRDSGAEIGFVQVGAHAGHVAHVVAHVIGNNSRVSRVILRDAGLHLAHQVGAHVGSLGEDAAAHTGKQRHGGGTHAE